MTSPVFETELMSQKLRKAGFSSQQADAVIQVMGGCLEQTDLATRRDLEQLRESLCAEIKLLIAESEGRTAEKIGRAIAESESRMVRLILWCTVTSTGIMIALVSVLALILG